MGERGFGRHNQNTDVGRNIVDEQSLREIARRTRVDGARVGFSTLKRAILSNTIIRVGENSGFGTSSREHVEPNLKRIQEFLPTREVGFSLVRWFRIV